MALRATVIDWDGTTMPEELRQLPPGRYLVKFVEDIDELSAEEEAAVLEGLAELEAGNVIPYEEAVRQIRTRQPIK